MSVKVHEVLVKQCNLCKEIKPLSEFGKNKRNSDGLAYYCKSCSNQRRYDARHGIHYPRIISTKERHRICSDCKMEKPLEDFTTSKNKSFGVHGICKSCMNIRRKNDPNHNENARNAHHKRRMNALLTLRNPAECFHCFMSDLRILSIDHLHDNGSDERKNIKKESIYRKIIRMGQKEALKEYQILCRNCNWLKRLEMKDVKSY